MLIVLLFVVCTHVCALDNGVVQRPPMGVSSWLTMKLNVSAGRLMQWADEIVSSGLREAGYTYAHSLGLGGHRCANIRLLGLRFRQARCRGVPE